MNREVTETLNDAPIDWRDKGFLPTADLTIGTVAERGWNVLDGDALFPLMVLHESALEHNLRTMARYCAERRLTLAPHGKTTMAPQLFARQLAAGAWGMTAATVSQIGVYRHFGIERILMANELVEPAAVDWIADELERDPAFSFLCLVDSEAGVALMEETLRGRSAGRRRLCVLVEVGAPRHRTGARTVDEARRVADAVRRSERLELAGVECYEGVLGGDRSDETLAAVDALLDEVRSMTETWRAEGVFAGRDEIVVSAGGSAFFDRVAERLRFAPGHPSVRVVLRSGCYLIHDHLRYEELSPLSVSRVGPAGLRPALELWGVVLSRPEPDLAIVGFGRRDVSYDIGLPLPIHHVRRGGHQARAGRDGRGAAVALRGELTVVALNDQHAFVRGAERVDLAVGDLIGCGISHPCTAFDKWRLIALVDDAYRITGAIRTFF